MRCVPGRPLEGEMGAVRRPDRDVVHAVAGEGDGPIGAGVDVGHPNPAFVNERVRDRLPIR
jgi:hypothetical protein